MFTLKYRFYVPADQQPVDGPAHYDQCESCHGPYECVSQERQKGYIVVHGIDSSGQPMTFGPHKSEPRATGDLGEPRPIVWVMNATGATIARYDL